MFASGVWVCLLRLVPLNSTKSGNDRIDVAPKFQRYILTSALGLDKRRDKEVA